MRYGSTVPESRDSQNTRVYGRKSVRTGIWAPIQIHNPCFQILLAYRYHEYIRGCRGLPRNGDSLVSFPPNLLVLCSRGTWGTPKTRKRQPKHPWPWHIDTSEKLKKGGEKKVKSNRGQANFMGDIWSETRRMTFSVAVWVSCRTPSYHSSSCAVSPRICS